MKISLQESFGRRNDLKREIEELKESTTQNLWDDESLPTNFSNGTVINPVTALTEIVSKMDELAELNKRIYEANVANNGLLRDLETIGAKIAIYERVSASLKQFPGEKERNRWFNKDDPTSKEVVVNVLNIDPKEINEKLASLKKEKRHVEEVLRRNNYTLMIEV